VLTGWCCAYCDLSLGCQAHRISIEEHVETICPATPEQRAEIDARCSIERRQEIVRAARATLEVRE
jgi:hypothetical protein